MIKSYISIFCIFLCCILDFGCVPPNQELELEPEVDWSLEGLQEIINIADERRVEVLKTYLSEPDVSKRFVATQAFGSIKDESVLDDLYDILVSDPSSKCRENAAFALGQSGQPKAGELLVKSFRFQDSVQVNNPVRKAILEGVGKVGNEQALNFIADQSTYLKSHDQLLLGQARALYQFGLRGMNIQLTIFPAAPNLQSHPQLTQNHRTQSRTSQSYPKNLLKIPTNVTWLLRCQSRNLKYTESLFRLMREYPEVVKISDEPAEVDSVDLDPDA